MTHHFYGLGHDDRAVCNVKYFLIVYKSERKRGAACDSVTIYKVYDNDQTVRFEDVKFSE